MVLFVLGFGWVIVDGIRRGEFTLKGGFSSSGFSFLQPGGEGKTILILVIAGAIVLFAAFLLQMVTAGMGAMLNSVKSQS